MAKLEYRKRGMRFTWEGGSYIDVDNGGEYPVATIDVWDYGTGEPSLPVEQAAFEAECDEWLDGLCREEIAEYGVQPE